MSEPRFTLTGTAASGLLAQLQAEGFSGPYKPDDKAAGIVTDRGDHAVGFFFATRTGSKLPAQFALSLCNFLNGLDAEAKAARDPFDPPHLDAVSEQSKALAAKLARNRPEAAE